MSIALSFVAGVLVTLIVIWLVGRYQRARIQRIWDKHLAAWRESQPKMMAVPSADTWQPEDFEDDEDRGWSGPPPPGYGPIGHPVDSPEYKREYNWQRPTSDLLAEGDLTADTLVAMPDYDYNGYWAGHDDGYEQAMNDIFERDLTLALERNGYAVDDDLVYPAHALGEMDCAS